MSVATDEQRLVLGRRPHRRHVGEALGSDLRVEFLRGVGDQDDLVGAHVDGDVLSRAALEMPVTGHEPMMPALLIGASINAGDRAQVGALQPYELRRHRWRRAELEPITAWPSRPRS